MTGVLPLKSQASYPPHQGSWASGESRRQVPLLVGHHKQDGGISPGHQHREGSSVPQWGHTKGHRHLKSNSGPCQPNNDKTLPLEKAAEKFLTLGKKPHSDPKPRTAQYRKLSLKKPYTPRGLQQGGLGRPGPGFPDCLHQEQSLGLGSFHSHSEEPEMNTQGLDPCPLAGSHPSGGTDGNGGRSLRPREVTVDMVRAMGRRGAKTTSTKGREQQPCGRGSPLG